MHLLGIGDRRSWFRSRSRFTWFLCGNWLAGPGHVRPGFVAHPKATNAFIRDGSNVFRTYFINNRGDEQKGSTWNYLDITALGRQESWEDSPKGYPQTPPCKWWNWHDNYDAGASPDPKWVEVSDAGEAALRKRVERNANDLDSADTRA